MVVDALLQPHRCARLVDLHRRDPSLPSLEDVLSDPLVHLVMRRDRLSVADVRQVMDITQARLLVTTASATGPGS